MPISLYKDDGLVRIWSLDGGALSPPGDKSSGSTWWVGAHGTYSCEVTRTGVLDIERVCCSLETSFLQYFRETVMTDIEDMDSPGFERSKIASTFMKPLLKRRNPFDSGSSFAFTPSWAMLSVGEAMRSVGAYSSFLPCEMPEDLWASCTAIVAFCHDDIGVIAVDSRAIDIRPNVPPIDNIDKFTPVSPKLWVAASGSLLTTIRVQHELPGLINDDDLETVEDGIEIVRIGINNILMRRGHDYRREPRRTVFIVLCLVNGHFGIGRIMINSDGSEYIAEWQDGGFMFEGCGQAAMERYQRLHPIDEEIEIDDPDDMAGYAFACLNEAILENPNSCGGARQVFVIWRSKQFSMLNIWYPNEEEPVTTFFPHENHDDSDE